MIKKELYSFFGSIKDLKGLSDKKAFKQKIIDFINVTKETYKIEELNKNTSIKDEETNMLMLIGIIDTSDDIELLKELLKKDFNNLMNIVNCLITNRDNLTLNIKKFMDFYRKKAVKKYYLNDKKLTVVDFFCGSGGMSLGFSQEDFKILLSNDIEDACIKTYSFNHIEMPKDRAIVADIKDVIENIESYVNNEKVDVIIGGPPCQGFSMANRQRIINDPRNILYKHYVEAVHKLKPKFFVMENVKGMASVSHQVKEDFGDIYDVDFEVFNAKNFGVPQNRERLIYIGIRKDFSDNIEKNALNILSEIEEECKHTKKYLLEDALYGLRNLKALTIKNATELDTEESGKKIEKNSLKKSNEYINLINNNKYMDLIFNHKARYNNERDIEIYSRMIPGDKSDSERIADIMPYKSRSHIFKDKYCKLKMDEVCKTITAHMKFDCNMYVHPNQARGLTPREAARVQSYPDDYFFLGPYTKTYMQVGNSVPPLMSRKIANILKKYLKS